MYFMSFIVCLNPSPLWLVDRVDIAITLTSIYLHCFSNSV